MLQNILDNDILKSLYFTELKMLDLIVNPYAGRGRAKTDAKKVFEILDANNVKFAPHYTARKKHATEIAYNLTLSGAETIVSVGGDGTIHEIVNGIILARRELEKQGKPFVTRLALIPAGTGNDFMRSANLPLSLKEATNRILSGSVKPVDAIEIDGTYEICFACRGIDVDVVNMVNASKKKTSSSYLKKILLCIFKGIKYDFCINIDGKEIKTTGIVAAVLNGAVLAGGMHFCSPAKIDDGLLDVIVVEKRNPVSTLITLSKLPSGKGFIDGKIVKHFSGKHVVIETNQPLIDIDGELFENKKFDAKIAPNSINLIL